VIPFNYRWIGGALAGPNFEGESKASLPLFDLASLTKVICTFSLLAKDALESNLKEDYFDSTLLQELPSLASTQLSDLTIRECLEHRSGLPAHFLFFNPSRRPPFALNERAKLHDFLLEKIAKATRETGAQTVYSDIGFILLAVYLEVKHGRTIANLWDEWRSENLPGNNQLNFEALDTSCLNPTESRYSFGEVNDDNCRGMNSISSHAGLFGRAEDVWSWLKAIQVLFDNNPWLSSAVLSGGERFHLGWDSPSAPLHDSQAGSLATSFVRGHLGYTGTALWWDLKSARAGVLLSNRVCPVADDESKQRIKELRQRFFNAVWDESLDESFSF